MFLFAWKLAGKHEYVCNVHLSKLSSFWLKWIHLLIKPEKANLLPARFLDLFEQCLDPKCRAGWSLGDGEFTAAKHEVAEAIQPFVLAEAADAINAARGSHGLGEQPMVTEQPTKK